jgi:hypothetical protein
VAHGEEDSWVEVRDWRITMPAGDTASNAVDREREGGWMAEREVEEGVPEMVVLVVRFGLTERRKER